MFRILAPLVLIATLFANPVNGGEGDIAQVGQKAPNITSIASDGSRINSDDYKGKPILVVFFAIWCGGCVDELPKIERDFYQKYKDSGLIVICVGRGHSYTELTQFKRNKGFNFTIIEDPRRKVYSQYADAYIPRCYLIGKDGTIKHTTTGTDSYDFDQLKRKTAEELSSH